MFEFVVAAVIVALSTLLAVFVAGLVGVQAPWWAWAILVAAVFNLTKGHDHSGLVSAIESLREQVEELTDDRHRRDDNDDDDEVA